MIVGQWRRRKGRRDAALNGKNVIGGLEKTLEELKSDLNSTQADTDRVSWSKAFTRQDLKPLVMASLGTVML
jgi:hypothetical protein